MVDFRCKTDRNHEIPVGGAMMKPDQQSVPVVCLANPLLNLEFELQNAYINLDLVSYLEDKYY